MKVLVTGYGPFFAQGHNPSQELLRVLKTHTTSFDLTLKELPVEFKAISTQLEALELKSFEKVFFFGLAGSRKKVTIEKIALNIQYNPDRPDNVGTIFEVPKKIDASKNLVLESTEDCEALNTFFNDNSIPSELSYHAGTFVCNKTLFCGLNILDGESRCTFIHLPLDVDIRRLAQVLVSYLEES